MKEWHCMIDGRQYGPINEDELRRWAQENRLGPQDLVWSEGMAEWSAAATVPGLFPEGAPVVASQPVAQADYPAKGMGIASLVLGIVSIPTCFCYGVPAIICGALGLAFGVNSRRKAQEAGTDNPMAKAGVITGTIGLILGVVYLVIIIMVSA